jgi:hypothetical protein
VRKDAAAKKAQVDAARVAAIRGAKGVPESERRKSQSK